MEVSEILKGMGEIYGRQMTPASAAIMLSDLSVYPDHMVKSALKKCRLELTRFPSLSDILDRIDDGHPGAEQAWASLPKGEGESVCWTEEMRQAHYEAFKGGSDDMIATRMAFKEIYIKLLSKAREERRPPKWNVSLGHDPRHREKVIREATDKNLLSQEHARQLLPAKSFSHESNEVQRLIGSSETQALEHNSSAPIPVGFASVGEVAGSILKELNHG